MWHIALARVVTAAVLLRTALAQKSCETPNDCPRSQTCFKSRCEVGAPGLPCTSDSDCKREHCFKHGIGSFDGRNCSGSVECTDSSECFTGEACWFNPISDKFFCYAGKLGMPCVDSRDCLSIYDCAKGKCRVEGTERRDRLAEDIGKVGDCWTDDAGLPRAFEVSEEQGVLVVSLMILIGSVLLAAHAFVATKMTESSWTQKLRTSLCVCIIVLYSVTFGTTVYWFVNDYRKAKDLNDREAIFMSCLENILVAPVSDIALYRNFTLNTRLYILVGVVNVVSLTIASVLEVIRTERLRRAHGRPDVHDRWIALAGIFIGLVAINATVSVLSSLIALRRYTPAFEGCEYVRGGDKSALFCDPDVTLRGYEHLGAGVSDACRSLQRVALPGSKSEKCNSDTIEELLKAAGASDAEAFEDVRLAMLTSARLLTLEEQLPVNFFIAANCVAVVIGLTLILMAWNVSPLLVAGERRKRVLALAMLYIIFSCVNVGLFRLMRAAGDIAKTGPTANHVCGCNVFETAVLKDLVLAINIGGVKGVVFEILVPSIVAASALKEVVMKRRESKEGKTSSLSLRDDK